MTKCLLIFLIVLLASGCAGSRTSRVGTVEGNVVEDPTGTPLRFARVRMISSEALVGGRLNWDGARETLALGTSARFAWRDIIPASYFVQARDVGYEPSEVTVQVVAGESVHVTFRLRRGTSGVTSSLR